MLERAYEFLKVTPPFLRWKLPDVDDIKFVVSREPGVFGKWEYLNNSHTIQISSKTVGHINTLLMVMAHEMIHVHVKMDGHGALFRRHARSVCKYHGFDPKAF